MTLFPSCRDTSVFPYVVIDIQEVLLCSCVNVLYEAIRDCVRARTFTVAFYENFFYLFHCDLEVEVYLIVIFWI